MEKEKISTTILYLFLVIAMVVPYQTTSKIAIVTVWGILAVLAFFMGAINSRFRDKNDKIKSVLIAIILYYILYELLGLVIGYRNSPYSLKLVQILKNTVFIVGVVALQEYVRTKLVTQYDKRIMHIFITLFFIFLSLDINVLWQSTSQLQSLLEYLLVKVIPAIVESVLLTYLSLKGGYLLNYAYSIPNAIALIVLPIFPDVDWFIETTSRYVLSLLIFILVSYEQMVRGRKISRKQVRKENPMKTIPVILCVIGIVGFVAGVFPYKPVAVISNSMIPTFARGDVCIVKQIKKQEEMDHIKVGDILEYRFNKALIVHRVIEIEKKGDQTYWYTKGDNNEMQDAQPVTSDQVSGVIKQIIPYLGYPSVWFTELLNQNR